MEVKTLFLHITNKGAKMSFKKISLLIICFSIFSCRQHPFALREGDIIFQESGVSQTENSIQEVTNSIEGYNFTHVGIVAIDEGGNAMVLEAVPPLVTITRIEEFLYPEGKNNPYPVSVVGRLKPEYRRLVPAAIEEGRKLVGLPYDHAYTLGDDKYYCSEYIYEIFKRANGGKEVFSLNRMTFKSPGTDMITEGWVQHFEKLGMPVPEGEDGINPGAMSTCDIIDIVHKYQAY